MVTFISPIYSQDQNLPLGEPLRIGVLAVMSGAGAMWGLIIKYCAQAHANIINGEGGFVVDGVRHEIEIVSVDTQMNPRVAVAGAESLVNKDGVKYILGPVVDSTVAAVLPIIEEGGALVVPYSFGLQWYSPPHYNSMEGNVSAVHTAPIIYKYMIEEHGVKTISFVARNDTSPLWQRKEGIRIAQELGLEVLSSVVTYEAGTNDFFPILSKALTEEPDLLVLSGVSPGDAPLLAKAARQLGYEGQISTETNLDAKVLVEGAGEYAEGFVFSSGGSTPEMRSKYMERYMEEYIKIAGEWNDEAGTKLYAIPYIIYTIQESGSEALKDVEAFKEAMPDVEVDDPFVNEKYSRVLKWVGEEYIGQNHQVSVPIVITQIKNGKSEVAVVGELR
ncbi:MAG: ABC transporter substrate-binding protein [Atribacterota bacterium]|nr:ABC transporter substrate-binding protein [Atribacterota bacterium]